jgi:hypothetical protein
MYVEAYFKYVFIIVTCMYTTIHAFITNTEINYLKHEFIIYILIGFASDCIEIYIKPNTTAAIVCPYKGIQKAPITWRNSNKSIGVGDTVGDREGKFTIKQKCTILVKFKD